MFRTILYLLIAVLLISIIRMIVGVVMKGFSDLLQSGGAPETRSSPAENVPLGGELKRDPVCGTFVAESTALKRQIAGKTYFYCSDTCREKHTV